MTKTTNGAPGIGRGANDWHADKPMLTKPKIIGSKEIEGVQYYVGTKGRLYIPHLFDAMFKTIPGRVLKRHSKSL